MSLHVLLVDSDADSAALATAGLRAARPRGHAVTVTVATSWQAAKVRIVLDAFDVIVLRERVGDVDATAMLRALAGLPHPPVVVAIRDGDVDAAIRFLRAGADDCVMHRLGDWPRELRRTVERLAAPGPREHASTDATGNANEYAAVMAALFLQRTTPRSLARRA